MSCLAARTLDYHLVLPVLVPLVLLVLVAAATVRRAVLLVLGHVRHVRVDALGVQGRHGPRERGRLEVRDGHVPGTGVARPLGLAASGGQLLDRLQKRERRRDDQRTKEEKEGRDRGGRRGEKGKCTPSRKGRLTYAP